MDVIYSFTIIKCTLCIYCRISLLNNRFFKKYLSRCVFFFFCLWTTPIYADKICSTPTKKKMLDDFRRKNTVNCNSLDINRENFQLKFIEICVDRISLEIVFHNMQCLGVCLTSKMFLHLEYYFFVMFNIPSPRL